MRSVPEYQETTRPSASSKKSAQSRTHPESSPARTAPGELPCFVTRRFVPQCQYVTHRKDVALRGVLNLSQAPVGAHQPQRAALFALLQEDPPQLLNLSPEARLCKLVKSTTNDSFSWQPEQPGRTTTGVSIIAVIIGDEDGFGWLVDNRTENQFKLFQAVVQQPLVVLWLGDAEFILRLSFQF